MRATAPKLLFTPGPLTTSATVKEAMLRDLPARDAEFVAAISRVREKLLAIAGTDTDKGWEAIPLSGAGTYALEAVVGSVIARDGGLLVLVNGTYGGRIAEIAERLGIHTQVIESPEHQPPDVEATERALAGDPKLTHVALIHCETTTGILNPLAEVGAAVRRRGRSLIVDAMSSFGAVAMDVEDAGADYVVASSNKGVEGVPGLAFVLARRTALIESEGRARSVCFDLLEQWRAFERNGQFRFTPPTNVLLAFDQALRELDEEGGPAARARRYRENHEVLIAGMKAIGFRTYIDETLQSPLVVTFRYPECDRFEWGEFHGALSARGFVLHPGKLSSADCFRVATIGQITPDDVRAFLGAVEEVLGAMEVRM